MAGFLTGLIPLMSSAFGKAIGSTAMSSLSGQLNQSLSAHRNTRLDFETWKKKFDYSFEKNSPLSQRRRLEAAGLNPALMYQGGTGAGLSTSISQSTPSGQNVDTTAMSSIVNQTKVADAEVNKLEAEADLLRSQKTGQDNRNRTFDEEFRNRMANLVANTNDIQLQNEWQTITNEILSATKETEINSKIQNLNKLIADTNLTNEQIAQVRADVSLKAATVKLNESLARHADAQTWQISELTPKQVAFLVSEIANIEADTERTNYDLHFDRSTREWQEAIVRYTAEDTYQLSELRENQRITQRILNENSGKHLLMEFMKAGASVLDAIPFKVNLSIRR